jgi:hypothetical protein
MPSGLGRRDQPNLRSAASASPTNVPDRILWRFIAAPSLVGATQAANGQRKSAMWPGLVVMHRVLTKDSREVAPSENPQAIEALRPECSDHRFAKTFALGARIGVRMTRIAGPG